MRGMGREYIDEDPMLKGRGTIANTLAQVGTLHLPPRHSPTSLTGESLAPRPLPALHSRRIRQLALALQGQRVLWIPPSDL